MKPTRAYEDEAAGAADELRHEQGRRFLKRELPHLSDAEVDELLCDLLRVSDDERRQWPREMT